MFGRVIGIYYVCKDYILKLSFDLKYVSDSKTIYFRLNIIGWDIYRKIYLFSSPFSC